MISKVLSYLNGTRMFFNLWLLASSLPLLKSGVLDDSHFAEILLVTTGVYFLGATGSYLVYTTQGQNPEHAKPAQRKFTAGEFLYFCMIFGLAYVLLQMKLIDADTYFTIVVWVYCLYNGVNVGHQFLKARASRIASILDMDAMPQTVEKKESEKRPKRRRRHYYEDAGDEGDPRDEFRDDAPKYGSDDSDESDSEDESDTDSDTKPVDPRAGARSFHD